MRFLPGILAVVLAIYCWIEIVQSDPKQVRQLSRWVWSLIVFVPFFGPAAWLIYGRPNGDDVPPTAPKPRRTVVAPDDDPDFLRSLRRLPKPPTDGDDRSPA